VRGDRNDRERGQPRTRQRQQHAGDDLHTGRAIDQRRTTDHVAAYGLAALIGVVAVKKPGLLALIGVFALKFAKLGAVAIAGLGALGTKLFKRKAKARDNVA
jgi:uncharacterized membrane-anchored protein